MEHSIIKKPALVVSLDIGSTYCGYAWQWRDKFEKDKGNVEVNNNWQTGSVKLNKTSSCILLKYEVEKHNQYEHATRTEGPIDLIAEGRKYKIEEFGQRAERRYKKMTEKSLQDVAGTWFFFRRFKHWLSGERFQLIDNLVIEDHLGQLVPLVIVMSKLIEALKTHFLKYQLATGETDMKDNILWIVTVPVIWSPKAKKLMRDAAEMADISSKKLLLANEPEAAVVYCMFLPEKQRESLGNIGLPGQTFLVVDLGGLTVDLSAVRVLKDGLLEEVTCSIGDIGGGQNINDAFLQTCQDSFSGHGWDLVYQNCTPSELLEMELDFEMKKVQIGTDDEWDNNIELNVPKALISELEEGHVQLKDEPETKKYFSFDERFGKFEFNPDLIKNKLFGETLSAVYDVIDKELGKPELNDCKNIVLVGGFAESPIVRERLQEIIIQRNYPDKRVVSPSSPFLAVMKGAVLFGHDPMIFRSRISRETFGVRANGPFKPEIHNESKKMFNPESGSYECIDIFHVHVKKGQSVILQGSQPSKKYYPRYGNQTAMKFDIYSSDKMDPKYTTDQGCKQIGTITVDMLDTTGGLNRVVEVAMIYGGTELAVTAKNISTGQEYSASIKFT